MNYVVRPAIQSREKTVQMRKPYGFHQLGILKLHESTDATKLWICALSLPSKTSANETESSLFSFPFSWGCGGGEGLLSSLLYKEF